MTDTILRTLRYKIQQYVTAEKDFRAVAMQLFNEHFNREADGRLRPQQLAVGLKNLDIPIADGDVGRLMQVLDQDADGYLSDAEFMSAIGSGVATTKHAAAAKKKATPVKHVPPASPGHGPAESPAQGKLVEPTRHRYPRSLVISDSNNALASKVFDLLDANGDGRLDATDFAVVDSVGMTDMEREFHGIHAAQCGLCARLPCHCRCCVATPFDRCYAQAPVRCRTDTRYACAVAIRPVPAKNGMDVIEFRNRCARYVTDSARHPASSNELGAPKFPASLGPQTLNLQMCTMVDVMRILEARMNAELEIFLRHWEACLENSTGRSVAQLHLDRQTTVPMMKAVYNGLDALGDNDGVLSKSDGDAVWQYLIAQKIVEDNDYVVSLNFEQFRLALVKRVLDSATIAASDVVHLRTGQDVANFLEQKIDAEVKKILEQVGTSIVQYTGAELKANALDIDGLGTLSHSIVLTKDTFDAAKQVFDSLDVDQDGKLDRDDFGDAGTNPLLARLGDQIMELDTNQDGVVRCAYVRLSDTLCTTALTFTFVGLQVTLAEFCTGVGRTALRPATWSPADGCAGEITTLGSFVSYFQAFVSREAYQLLEQVYNESAAGRAYGAAEAK